jgi:hypothetical protein
MILLSGINLSEAWLLERWQPAYRRRETNLGFYKELREPTVLMLREKVKWEKPQDESIEAKRWDRSTCKSIEGW